MICFNPTSLTNQVEPFGPTFNENNFKILCPPVLINLKLVKLKRILISKCLSCKIRTSRNALYKKVSALEQEESMLFQAHQNISQNKSHYERSQNKGGQTVQGFLQEIQMSKVCHYSMIQRRIFLVFCIKYVYYATALFIFTNNKFRLQITINVFVQR